MMMVKFNLKPDVPDFYRSGAQRNRLSKADNFVKFKLT
jgi:hypothetical protein